MNAEKRYRSESVPPGRVPHQSAASAPAVRPVSPWRRVPTVAATTAISIAIVVALAASFAQPPATAMSESEIPARLLPVAVQIVQPVDHFQIERSFTGMIRARRTSDLGFERSAKIVALHVDEGDPVREGQTLAELDTRQLLVQQRRLQAQRQEASALLEELQAGPREQTIAAARATVDDLKAQVELRNRVLRRSSELVREYATSKENYDQAELGLRSAEAQLAAAQKELEELEAGTRPERITAQRAVVTQLDQQLADIAIEISDSELKAPFDGRISQRLLDEGTVVAPAQSVFQVVETGQLEAHIGLPVDATLEFSPGDTFELTVDGRQWPATLDRLAPQVDLQTRTRMVVLRLTSEASERVVPGQIVRVSLERRVESEGFWVPTASLVRSVRGLWATYVAEPVEESATESDFPSGAMRVQRRQVEVLHSEGPNTLVRGTLEPGDRVIVSGTHRVVPGQTVSVEDTLTSRSAP